MISPNFASMRAVSFLRRLALRCLPLVGLSVLLTASATQATITITMDLTIIENRPVDDNLGFPGLHLLTRVDATHTIGSGPFGPGNATVSTNNSQFLEDMFGNNPVIPLTLFSPVGANGGTWSRLFPIMDTQVTQAEGNFNYIVTVGMESDSFNGNNLNRAEVVPHPTSLMVSDNSTSPTFTFVDPDPTPNVSGLDRFYNMVIFDSSDNEVAILPSPTTVATPPSIAVPPGVLSPGVMYLFRAQSLDVDGSVVENIGESLLEFTPIPESSHVAALGKLLIGALAIWERRKANGASLAGHATDRAKTPFNALSFCPPAV